MLIATGNQPLGRAVLIKAARLDAQVVNSLRHQAVAAGCCNAVVQQVVDAVILFMSGMLAAFDLADQLENRGRLLGRHASGCGRRRVAFQQQAHLKNL
ncbi:hypothetical protein D3C72_2289810 [compost metagenome]